MDLSDPQKPEYLFVVTQDGSPTLRLTSVDGESESMHSLRGAFAETVYIYGTAIERALQEGFEPRVLSLGLGLGYVEVLAVALQLRDAPQSAFGGESFELVPDLRDFFRAWALEDREKVPVDFLKAYDQILELCARHTEIDGKRIRARLADLLNSGEWALRGPLDSKTEVHGQFGCLCFDAFSSKTSPDLWTEEFLIQFFGKVAAPGCVLSTYACTGTLKRALKANSFDLTIRAGFGSKRDSTFALRSATFPQV